MCSKRRITTGSSVWSGTGIFAYLEGDIRDPPKVGQGVGRFKLVPRPPDGWMAERFEPLDLVNTVR
eukprot:2440302-Prymnesium_polylepis.1